MRLGLVLLLTVALLVAAVPAFAASTTDGYAAAEGMGAYGYSDEAVTITDLATRLGVSEKQAAGMAMVVDGWTQGQWHQKLTAAQLANLAAGYHQYLIEHDGWDSFADAVAGWAEIGTGVLADLEPLYDSLGFATLAEQASYPDISDGGLIYKGGVGYDAVVPEAIQDVWGTGRADWSQGAKEQFLRFLVDRGSPLKYATLNGAPPVWTNTGSGFRLWYHATSTYTFRIKCAFCGYTSGNIGYTGTVGFFGWNLSTDAFTCDADLTGLVEHAGAHDYPSEAAVVIEELATSNGVSQMLLLASALGNPAGVALGAADAWGIPGYLPPDAINDSLDFASTWGADLNTKADELGSRVASMTAEPANLLEQGIGSILDGVAELMRWVANFWNRVQSLVLSLTVPTEGWLEVAVPMRLEQIKADLMTRFPFSYINIAIQVRDRFEAM